MFLPTHELYMRTFPEGKANSSEDRSNSIDDVFDLISCKDEAYPISSLWSIKAYSATLIGLIVLERQ